MTNNQYLQSILEVKSIAPNSKEMLELERSGNDIAEFLQDAFSEANPTIAYGGSKAKGTMIIDKYDLDIICYFPHEKTSAGATISEIYHNVELVLKSKYEIAPKTSAIRILDENKNYSHIDIVPGRYMDDSNQDVFIYKNSNEGERLKTNLQKHIEHIGNSGVTDAIKLMKIWSELNSVEIKTFALELLTIDLLRNAHAESLETQFLHVLTQFKEQSGNLRIEDPANPTGNDLSGLLDTFVRNQISIVADNSLSHIQAGSWENVLGATSVVDEADKIPAFHTITSQSEATQPWCK